MRPAMTQFSPVLSVFAVRSKDSGKDLMFLHAESKDSDQAMDAQADLSLRWGFMWLCRFCRDPANIVQN